jgi:hypothetical protein
MIALSGPRLVRVGVTESLEWRSTTVVGIFYVTLMTERESNVNG